MALNTAESAPSPEAREEIIAEVAWKALEIDPALAREAFLLLSADHPQKILLIQHFAIRLAEQSPDEALAWADTLSSESEIAAAKSQIALVLAETDPPRAANLLSESGIAGHAFDVAVVQVLQRWAAQSAPHALAWAITFPPGPARTAGISLIVPQWANTDAAAAFTWMRALEAGLVRKEAVLAMEKALLQQPQAIREAWLQHADSQIRSELEEQREPAMKEIGDNVPQPLSWKGNSAAPAETAEELTE